MIKKNLKEVIKEKFNLNEDELSRMCKELLDEAKVVAENGFVMMFFRKPELPAIVVAKNKLMPAYSFEGLARNLIIQKTTATRPLTIVIDNHGYEFHFENYRNVLRPDWFKKRWFKKDIIDLYNKKCFELQNHYVPSKKLVYIRLKELVFNICGHLSMNLN